MKVSQSIDELRRFQLFCTAGLYDSKATDPALIIETQPSTVVKERVALAEVLAFVGHISGPVETDSPLRPATAELLMRNPFNTVIIPSSVEWRHADVPSGNLRVAVDENYPGSPVSTDGSVADIDLAIHCPPIADVTGSLVCLRDRWIPDNARAVARMIAGGEDGFLHRRLSTLLIMGADLDARVFIIPGHWSHNEKNWSWYQLLFKSVGLTLEKSENAGGGK
ncbi:hypothetical protein [Kocuria marina]|uniref:hypothetical protein n=1 Tax=Kocuria marina TaxID=223184 RepID=UPI003460BA05